MLKLTKVLFNIIIPLLFIMHNTYAINFKVDETVTGGNKIIDVITFEDDSFLVVWGGSCTNAQKFNKDLSRNGSEFCLRNSGAIVNSIA